FGLSPFADYATAETAIATHSAGCYLYYFPDDSLGVLDSLSASFDGTALTGVIVSSNTGMGPTPGAASPVVIIKITGKSGDVISFAYTSSSTTGGIIGASLLLYDCSYSYLSQDDGSM